MAKYKSGELTSKVNSLIQELADATDEAKFSEKMLAYLELCTKFHQYSPNNQWLILHQKPNATHVAGITRWKKLGRWISGGKGCGIAILAPRPYEDKETGDTRIWFKVVYVFDVLDTDGEPLPEQPDWKSPEKNMQLHDHLMSFAEEKNIKVVIAKLDGECQGTSSKGKITLAPEAGTKTFVHELAHELMHWGEGWQGISSQLKELEAESVAYVVSKHFGLNDLCSMNYIALHKASGKEIHAHMDRIQAMAKMIIKYIEGKEDKNDTEIDTSTNIEIEQPVEAFA